MLNIERYERVESCAPHFRTMSLPGLKILIYNQTDFPVSSFDGVNVPPGYTMEIPFKMQKVKFQTMLTKQTKQSKQCLKDFFNFFICLFSSKYANF